MAPPPHPSLDVEAAHRARFMRSILRTMVVMACVGLTAALVDQKNNPLVSLAFYLPIFAAVFWMRQALARGRVALTAWVSAAFYWVLIAFVTLFFGGLKGENAACFALITLIVGTVIGGRSAIAVAVLSSLWCGLVGALEYADALPAQLGPYTPINAWTAITLTLFMTSVLLRNSLDSMRAVHAQAATLAAERDEALRRSIQAQKMELVGNLAGGVAHDFNNLLTVIVGVSESLREDCDARRASDPALLDDLESAAERAALMTRQLLTFGRVQPATVGPVDVAELVRAFAHLLPRLIGQAITIDVQTGPSVVAVATRVGIEQILLNLAVNARDAMPDGGQLRIRATAEGDRVLLVVEDTGVGMPASVREEIFRPFFTTKASGTGLGLSTVRTAVEQFGGAITVTSEPGRGTRFEIRLARVTEATTGAAATAPATAPSAPRVLLAEDDPLVQRVMLRILEQAGYAVVTATNGAEALAHMEKDRDFACVISDISMPVLDGLELAGRLAVLQPTLPVLLISGDRVPPEAAAGAGRAFVPKPVERRELLAALEALLGRPPLTRS